jgi:hypothetical protein
MRFLWALNRSNYHKKSIALNSMIMKFTKEKILAILLFLSGIVYIGFGIYFLFGDNPPTKPKDIFLVVSIFFLYPFFTWILSSK